MCYSIPITLFKNNIIKEDFDFEYIDDVLCYNATTSEVGGIC